LNSVPGAVPSVIPIPGNESPIEPGVASFVHSEDEVIFSNKTPYPPHGPRICKDGEHCFGPTMVVSLESDNNPEKELQFQIDEIMSELKIRKKAIRREIDWIRRVSHIIIEYQKKMLKVKEHIGKEKEEIASLLAKRKQILDEVKRKKLEQTLKVSMDALERLNEAAKNIHAREKEYDSQKDELSKRIAAMKKDIATLKGEESTSDSHKNKKSHSANGKSASTNKEHSDKDDLIKRITEMKKELEALKAEHKALHGGKVDQSKTKPANQKSAAPTPTKSK